MLLTVTLSPAYATHSNPFPCPKRHQTADIFKDHQVSCSGNSDLVTHHNAILCWLPWRRPQVWFPVLPHTQLILFYQLGEAGVLHVINSLHKLTMSKTSFTPAHATLNVGPMQTSLQPHTKLGAISSLSHLYCQSQQPCYRPQVQFGHLHSCQVKQLFSPKAAVQS